MDDCEDEAQYTREGVCPLLLRGSTYEQDQLQYSVFTLSFYCMFVMWNLVFCWKKKQTVGVCGIYCVVALLLDLKL